MSKQTTDQRFYYKFGNQLKNMAIIAVFGVGTFVYGGYMRDPTLRMFFMAMSGIYPLVILLTVLQTVRRLNFAELGPEGMTTTLYGVFHKRVGWADVGSMGKVTISGAECIGIVYSSAHVRGGWALRFRRRTFSYDELFRQGYAADGTVLTEAAAASYEMFGSKSAKTRGRKAKTAAAPVRMKQSYRLLDFLNRPSIVAWFGVSLACSILSGMLKHYNQVLSSIFAIGSLIAIGITGNSWVRYRRVTDTAQKKPKPQKSDDWLV